MMSSYFRFDGRLEMEMQRLIGTDRFAPYLSAAGYARDVLRLYSWNVAIASAFVGPISMVEVALRNTISFGLQRSFGPEWYANAAFLALDPTNRTRDNIVVATNRITRAVPNRPITEGRIVAEMYLGFSVYLLRPALNRTLWPILRPSFTRYTHRKMLIRYLTPIVSFRNRVAHHEPILNRQPKEM